MSTRKKRGVARRGRGGAQHEEDEEGCGKKRTKTRRGAARRGQ